MKHEKVIKRAIAAAKLAEAGYTVTDHECGTFAGRTKCYEVTGPEKFNDYIQLIDGEWV